MGIPGAEKYLKGEWDLYPEIISTGLRTSYFLCEM